MGSSDSSNESANLAIEFIRSEKANYESYHSHKESMAYAGLTAFAGAVLAILCQDQWPPESWGHAKGRWAIVGLTLLWLGVFLYLRFQLTRRRWAALRRAGCERVLAKWITARPESDELKPMVPTAAEKVARWRRVLHFVWPQMQLIQAIARPKKKEDSTDAYYPKALVEAWIRQESIGTSALEHERLVIVAGWCFYGVAVIHIICVA